MPDAHIDAANQSPVRRGFVQTPRGRLHYRRQGAGTPVLLLQVLPFSTAIFAPLMALMAQGGFDCIAMDLMGYGASDPRVGMWTVEDHAETLRDALQALDVRPQAILSGHFTAMVATEFAIRYSGDVGKLVLDGVPLWSRPLAQERLKAIGPAKALAEDAGDVKALWAAALGLLRKFHPALELTARNTPLLADMLAGFLKASLAPGTSEAIFRYDLEEKLPQLKTQTLIIGSPTDSLRDRHAQALALVPGARGHLFAEVNPLYAIDQPGRAAEYADVLKNFVSS